MTSPLPSQISGIRWAYLCVITWKLWRIKLERPCRLPFAELTMSRNDKHCANRARSWHPSGTSVQLLALKAKNPFKPTPLRGAA